MKDRGYFTDIQEDNFFLPFNSSFPVAGNDMRLELASMLKDAMDERRHCSSTYAYCSWQDYDDYLKYRKEVAAAANLLLQKASRSC